MHLFLKGRGGKKSPKIDLYSFTPKFTRTIINIFDRCFCPYYVMLINIDAKQIVRFACGSFSADVLLPLVNVSWATAAARSAHAWVQKKETLCLVVVSVAANMDALVN